MTRSRSKIGDNRPVAEVRSLALALLLALACAGCAGTPESGKNDATGTPLPAAGISITLGPPVASTQTRVCNAGTAGAFTYEIGLPTPDQMIRDGTEGARVDCHVNGDGTFDAAISGVAARALLPASFSFSGVIRDKNAPVENAGTMTSSSPDTGPLTGDVTGSPGCSFGPVVTFKQGAILTDLDCPLLGSLDDDSTGCSAKGTIAFEGCTASSE